MRLRAILVLTLLLAVAPGALAAPPANVIADAGPAPNFIAAPALAAQSDLGGWHVAAWVGPVEGEPGVHDVFTRPLAFHGDPYADPVRIGMEGVAGPPSVIGDAIAIAYHEQEEGFVVSYVASRREGTRYSAVVRAQRVDDDGRPDRPVADLSERRVASRPPDGLATAHDFGSDRTLVVWREPNAIVGRLVAWDGTTVGEAMRLTRPGDRGLGSPAVVARPDGRGFVVAWADFRRHGSTVIARNVSDGGVVGRPFQVPLKDGTGSRPAFGRVLFVSLAADYRNRLAIAWESEDARRDSTEVRAQLLSGDGRRARGRSLAISGHQDERRNRRPRITHGGRDDIFTVAWEDRLSGCSHTALRYRRIRHTWSVVGPRAGSLTQRQDPGGIPIACPQDPLRHWVEGGADLEGFVGLWLSGQRLLSAHR